MTVLRNAGIIDQNIDRPELFDDLFYDFVRLFEVGGIRCVALAFHAQSRNFGFGSLAFLIDDQIGECDICTLLGELQGDGFSDAACGARYDGDFSFE